MAKKGETDQAAALRNQLRNMFFEIRGKAEKMDTGGILSRQRVEEDPFEQFYSSQNLLLPPYDFDNLYSIYEENDVLQACVDAMQNNVDGFGYDLHFIGDDFKDKEKPEAKSERVALQNFFDYANDTESWMTIRKNAREDLEVLGNAAFEVVRNLKGEIALVYYLPFKRMRIAALKAGQEGGIKTKVILFRNGKPVTLTVKKTFRRFVQLSPSGKKLRWFKSFGDPRIIDATDGTVKSARDIKQQATEIIHLKLNFGGNVYGFPRWIGAVLDAMGRRSAQFVNYDLFDSQGIPPIAIMVSNGVLTDDSVKEIESMVRAMRGVTKWNRIVLLESHVESSGLEDKGQAKIELKNLTEYRKEDQMFDKYLNSTAHNTRHSFRLPPLYVGMTECYSADTETLTENGWKYFKEVEDGEKIATLNPKTQELEYHLPDGPPHVFWMDGEMYHFKNQNVDVLVTPGHNMYVGNNNEKEWKKGRADKILAGRKRTGRVKFKIATDGYSVPDAEVFELPVFQKRTGHILRVHEIPMDDMLTLTGLYLGDGSLSLGRNWDLSMTAAKQRKIKIFSEIGEKFDKFDGLSCTTCIKGTGQTKVSISGRGLATWVADNCGIGAYNKHIPYDFMDLNSRQSELILEGLIATDGNVRAGKTYDGLRLPDQCRLTSVSKELIDQTQILALKCGFRTKISEYQDTRTGSIYYYVNMFRKSAVSIMQFQQEIVHYSGEVYCFEVPNHLFVTRRNGLVGIHGNTYTMATSKAAKTVAEEQVFIPERQDFDELINQLIVVKEFKAEYWRYRTKGPRIVGSEEISKGVETFGKAGAFSVNHAIDMANEAFGLSMSKYPGKWAEYPLDFVVKLLEQGVTVEGLDELIGSGAIPPPKGGTLPQQLTLPIPVTKKGLPAYVPQKIMNSGLFNKDEKAVYKKLLMIQGAVESMAEEEHTDDTEFDSQDTE